MKKITIAIDGHSSTGKSTLAKQLAKHLGYIYVDTGAMYRAITLYARQNKLIDKLHFDKKALVEKLDEIELKFVFNPDVDFAEIYLNDVNVEQEIRSMEVSNYVSMVSEIPQVRTQLVRIQQKIGRDKGIVMDGRDIGTVVFPDAELKIFLTASAQVRAQRRYDELLNKGNTVSFEEVYDNIVTRDHIDTNRAVSPLLKAKDAIALDNSNISREEQFEMVLQHFKNLT